MVMFSILCLTNGFTVFFHSEWSASSFLTAYIGIPIFFIMYGVHRIIYWRDKWAWDPLEVDLKTGMDEVLEAEQPPVKRKGIGRVCMLIE